MRTMANIQRASMLAVAAMIAAADLSGCGAGARPSSVMDGPSARESTSVTGPALSHGGPVRDHVSFVDRLRADGVRVDILRSVRTPWMRPEGTRLRLTGGGLDRSVVVDSYNYDADDLGSDPARLLGEDAARIRGGRVVGDKAGVEGPARWFRAERLLVLYAGSDRSAIRLLSHVLGIPFAGPRAGAGH